MKKSIATSVVLAVFVILPMATNAEGAMSGLDEERKAIGRALVEINPSNWTSLLPNYTVDIEYHDPIVTIEGIEDMTEFLGRLFGAGQTLVTTVKTVCPANRKQRTVTGNFRSRRR